MRICQVMAGDEEGGLETHFVDLANGLASLGDDVVVIAHERYRGRFATDVEFHDLDLTKSRRNPFLRRHLRRLIDSVEPDVVHAHAGKAATLVATVDPSCRTVGTVHGLKKDLSAYRRFDAVIGVSRGVVEGLDHPAKAVVYNGVHPWPRATTGTALRALFGIPPETTVTLAAGRLVRVKGYDRLIGLWDHGSGHLLIAGDGPEREHLESLAAGKPVTLAGFRPDVRSLMGGADLMVFASEREGLSYSLAEALLARLPVVSTPVAGAEELLPASHLAEISELGKPIARCLKNPDAARARMKETFDWAEGALTVDRMVRSTRAVYAAGPQDA
ncbi:MAG: glycosyltransferase [Gammaproteobacteria bacterium]|nr:glycosyltransferase [Gammaproteobacteria bacterium]MDE0441695.1 glycosyltransferase [Gammaproteobacteria bacterium]